MDMIEEAFNTMEEQKHPVHALPQLQEIRKSW